jgi:lipopolysaccharide export system protein LptC
VGWRHPRFYSIAFALLLAVGCRKGAKQNGSAQDAGTTEQPEFVMSPFRIQAFGAPGIEWELRSPQARAYTSMNVMRAEHVDLTLYQHGEKSTNIQSEHGVFCIQNGVVSPQTGIVEPSAPINENGILLKSGDMFLNGNVVVVSTDGTKLFTNWLHYQKSREVIQSTAPVKIVRTDSITNGTGLEATPDLQRIRIFNQTLTIKDDNEKK